jgi:hypothetical protein
VSASSCVVNVCLVWDSIQICCLPGENFKISCGLGRGGVTDKKVGQIVL